MRGGDGRDGKLETARVMTEAMKRVVEGPPSEPLAPGRILAIVREMQAATALDATGRAAVFSGKYPGFMEQCPALFQKACRPGLDMGMLEFMVGSVQDNGEEESASLVGSRLAERFVTSRSEAGGEGGAGGAAGV